MSLMNTDCGILFAVTKIWTHECKIEDFLLPHLAIWKEPSPSYEHWIVMGKLFFT